MIWITIKYKYHDLSALFAHFWIQIFTYYFYFIFDSSALRVELQILRLRVTGSGSDPEQIKTNTSIFNSLLCWTPASWRRIDSTSPRCRPDIDLAFSLLSVFPFPSFLYAHLIFFSIFTTDILSFFFSPYDWSLLLIGVCCAPRLSLRLGIDPTRPLIIILYITAWFAH